MSHTEIPELTDKHIRRLWERMAEIYGHRWLTSFGDHDKNNTWLKGLNGFTPTMVKQGLEACVRRADNWPPTLPEFRAMCLSLPDRDSACYVAIYELHNHENRTANMIRNLIGESELNNSTYDKLERRAKSLYPEAVERLTNFMLKTGVARLQDLTHRG